MWWVVDDPSSVRHIGWCHIRLSQPPPTTWEPGVLARVLFPVLGNKPSQLLCWTLLYKSPLAQVHQFHDLVTDRWLSVVSTSEPSDKACHFQSIYSLIFFSLTFFPYVNREQFILRPHELNRWEDLFYHHRDLTTVRMLCASFCPSILHTRMLRDSMFTIQYNT